MSRPGSVCPVVLLLTLVFCRIGTAQELEPRAYAPLPVGTNFATAAVSHSSGGVIVDPSLPVSDVSASSTVTAIGFGRTFNLFGQQALLLGALPYAVADASGQVGVTSRHVTRSGLADARVRLSVVLAGARALGPRDFARAPRGTVLGASITVAAPTGQYNPARLVNLGANRWGFKPEVGVSQPRGRWTLEAAAGVWFFTENGAFFPGQLTRAQRPIGSLQGHVVYAFRPQLWVAVDGTWYAGGRTEVAGVLKSDLQRNTRVGGTLAIPVSGRQSLKISCSTGASVRIGGDFTTWAAVYQVVWFDRPAGPRGPTSGSTPTTGSTP